MSYLILKRLHKNYLLRSNDALEESSFDTRYYCQMKTICDVHFLLVICHLSSCSAKQQFILILFSCSTTQDCICCQVDFCCSVG